MTAVDARTEREPDDRPGPSNRSLVTAFVAISLIAIAIVLATFAANPVGSAVTSDDGAYALEVVSLLDGNGWSVPHRLANVDPSGVTYPYVNSTVTRDGYFPAGGHLLWAGVLYSSARLFGLVGMRILLAGSLVATIGLTGALSAAAGRRKSAVVAMALVATSPLLFNSIQLWAHTAAAAAIALVALGSLRWMNDGAGVRWPALAVLGCVVASAIRGEGLLFAVATAVVVLGAAIRHRRRSWVGFGALLLGSSVASFVAANRFDRSVIGEAPSGTGAVAHSRASGSWSGRLAGAVQTFFSSVNDHPRSFLLVLVAVVLVAGAVLAIRMEHPERAVPLVLGAAAVWVVRVVAYPSETATGLIGAWPVALLALAVPWRLRTDDERRMIAIIALGSLGVAATQYDIGGGFNWGGRFLAPALPLLAVLIASALPSVEHARITTEPLAASAAILVLVLAGASIVLDARVRADFDAILVGAGEPGPDVPIVTSALHVPRMDWAAYPRRQWLLVPAGPDGPEKLRSLLAKAHVDDVVFYLTRPKTAEAVAGHAISFDSIQAGLVASPTPATVDFSG